MSDFEVPEALICSPFEAPARHWHLDEGIDPDKRQGRRPAIYFYPAPSSDIRLKATPVVHLILETKGYDPLVEIKAAAAERWVAAVTADGQFGRWSYALARKVSEVRDILDRQAE